MLQTAGSTFEAHSLAAVAGARDGADAQNQDKARVSFIFLVKNWADNFSTLEAADPIRVGGMRERGSAASRFNDRAHPEMTIDRIVLAFAGATVLVSLALGFYVHPYWYAVTAFMGANLMQASVTGFCPLAFLAEKLGARAGAAFH